VVKVLAPPLTRKVQRLLLIRMAQASHSMGKGQALFPMGKGKVQASMERLQASPLMHKVQALLLMGMGKMQASPTDLGQVCTG